MSRTFVYLLTVAGPEDIIKIGITRCPISRWSSFDPRWFENFDLEHSQLIETDMRQEAQSLETRLHRALRVHSCPAPHTILKHAGGETEWYRGAASHVITTFEALAAAGYARHSSAFRYVANQMVCLRSELLAQAFDASRQISAGTIGFKDLSRLRTWIDAHRAFHPEVDELLGHEMLETLGMEIRRL